MRWGGYGLTAAGTALSAYQFSQDMSQGNWGSAALSGSSFAGGGLVLGGSLAGSGTLVAAGTVLSVPGAVVGAGATGVAIGTYINNNTEISDTAAKAGEWVEHHTGGSVYAGATAAALTSIATSPYYAVKAADHALEQPSNWLGDRAYKWLH